MVVFALVQYFGYCFEAQTGKTGQWKAKGMVAAASPLCEAHVQVAFLVPAICFYPQRIVP